MRRLGWVDDRHADLAIVEDVRVKERLAVDRQELERGRPLGVLGRKRQPPREDARVPHRRLLRRNLPARRLQRQREQPGSGSGATAAYSAIPLEKVLRAVWLRDGLRYKHERVILAPALPLCAQPVLGRHRMLQGVGSNARENLQGRYPGKLPVSEACERQLMMTVANPNLNPDPNPNSLSKYYYNYYY